MGSDGGIRSLGGREDRTQRGIPNKTNISANLKLFPKRLKGIVRVSKFGSRDKKNPLGDNFSSQSFKGLSQQLGGWTNALKSGLILSMLLISVTMIVTLITLSRLLPASYIERQVSNQILKRQGHKKLCMISVCLSRTHFKRYCL
jgi:hypothetical protein